MTNSVTPELSTRYPEVRVPDALDELRRESAARHRTYPQSVQLGRMTQAEADYQIALVDALIEDMTRWGRFLTTRAPQPAQHTFTWHQRRAAITRELAYRARVYPDWIARGKLEQADADKATGRLSAIADFMDDGWDWHARNGLRILFDVQPATAAEAEAQAEWSDHYTTVMQARGYLPANQKELAL